jgi:hypothetical protein
VQKKLTFKIIKDLIEANPLTSSAKSVLDKNLKNIESHLKTYNSIKAVLGIDIYQYSQYQTLPQMLIPHLFKQLYNDTISNCLEHEPFIFKNTDKKLLLDNFIDTGDGGFQIFENPFQAITFAIYFQSNISRYNSIHVSTQNLFEIIDEITLRYSLTYDSVYSFEKNHYGPSIINCARIMSKDKLNRFLIDENTKKWFSKEFNGIENLQFLEIQEDFKNIPILNKDSDDEIIESIIFDNAECEIYNVDLMKIGEIKSKLDILSIYNLRLQTLMLSPSSNYNKHAITLGNLNSNGLAE